MRIKAARGEKMVKRSSIILYYRNKKVLKNLDKFHLNIAYTNHKAGYAVAYLDSEYVEKVKKQLMTIHGIKKVEDSLNEMDYLDFEE